MGLKILHTADWHLDSPFASFPPAQRGWLKQEQRRLPGKIAELCRRENCDMMLIAGDVFDGEPTADTVALVKKALKSAAVPVLIAPGNHDFVSQDSPWEEEWPENVYIFRDGLEAVRVEDLNCRVYGAGYRSMDCESLLQGFQAEGEEAYRIALLHGDPMQSDSPYCPVTANQVRQSGLHYLALGHIHKAGAFRAGQTLCAWPGCPMGRGWDETGEKGVCIVTIEAEAEVRAVMLDTLRFYEKEVDIGSDAREALEDALPVAGSRDFYRITLTGYGQVELTDLRRSFPQIPNLELTDATQPPLDLWGSAGEDTLEGIYFQMLRKEMEAQPENADAVRLAAELSRKLLSGREVVL